MKKSKKHYVTKWQYDNCFMVYSACHRAVVIIHPEATYRKNHVTCGNCRRTKVFRGVK